MRSNKNVGFLLKLYEVFEDVRVGKLLEEVAVLCFPILGNLFAGARFFLFVSLRRSARRNKHTHMDVAMH